MKPILKYCLVAICLSMPGYLFSQNFISETKVWRIGAKIYSEPCCGYRNDAFRFRGDSTINDTTYMKLCESTDESLTNWQLFGLWRETPDQKVYQRNYYGEEILMYNFSLVKNDTFRTANITLKVDSVLIKNWGGKLRKHWYLNPVSGDDFHRTVWIEGVGQPNGLIHNINGTVGATPFLLCFSENGQLVYQNPEYNTCYFDGLNTQSFVSTDKLWSTMKGPVSGCSSFFCESYFTKFSGDTLIDGIHYLKVLCSDDQQMQNWIIEGFIREDTNKKVYYRDTNSNDECLLYDFGCKTGDTLQLNCVCKESDFLVDSIKSLIENDVQRKYFYLTYLENETKEVWIEGIGSNWGVLNGGAYSHCMTGGGEALLCFYEDGIKKYQSPEFPNFCFLSKDIIDGTDPVKAVSEFKVYPNPALNELFIRASQGFDEDCTLELFSMKGELLKTKCLDVGTNIHRLDISTLTGGIYILRLIYASGSYAEKVIVKK